MPKTHLIAAVFAISARSYADDGFTPPDGSEEIEVQDTAPKEVGSTRIAGEEARQMPGAMGDPVRGIGTLPGFVPVRTLVPFFYVRGAPPGDVAYLVDGVQVPVLFHDGVVSSVIAPGLVESIEVYPSAVPARYGGSAGGVVALETRPPATERDGEAAVKLYEASALIESPFAGDGSALAAARIGYPGLVTQLFDDNVRLWYWDYQTRASWKLDDHNRLGLFAFGSHDRSTDNVNGRAVENFHADFHRLDLRYDHDFGARGRVRLAATGGWSELGAAGNLVADTSYGARVDAELQLARRVTLRAGARIDGDLYSVASSAKENPAAGSPASAMPAPTNLTGLAYLDAPVQVTDGLQIVPGLRVGVFRSRREGASGTFRVADPTVAARYRITDEVTSHATFGIAHQYPRLRVGDAPSLAASVPGFPTDDVRLQRSVQGALGVELAMRSAITATATAFASRIRGVSDLPNHCLPLVMGFICPDRRPDATSYGLELSIRRPLTQRLAGLVSYTFSKTTEQFPDATQRSPFDRRHVLNVAASYDLGPYWRAGVRGVLYTGEPFLPDVKDGHAVGTGTEGPAFYRADLRFERRWALGPGRSISLVFDILNATLSREHGEETCSGLPPGETCPMGDGMRFVVPSVGVEGAM